jgi:hypothetical protein
LTKKTIYIGYDPRERAAYGVAQSSLQRRLSTSIPIHALALGDVINRGLYTRPTEVREGRLWDVISGAWMSTEHANARFLAPALAKTGWALFMDGDMLVRSDVAEVFEDLDPAKAVYCVKHRHEPEAGPKMDGQVQQPYARKNWTSFMLLNCDHPANRALTPDLINTAPGRDMHRFCWLESEDLIGELDPAWNWLVGHSDPAIEPKVVHFTDGVPDMPGYENVPYADEWRAELRRMAA